MKPSYIDELKADPRFQRLSPEKQEKLIEDVRNAKPLSADAMRRIRDFAKRLRPFIEMWNRPAIRSIGPFGPYTAYLKGETQAERYALAGFPYGHHTRGRKRWLREIKAGLR